MIDAANAVPPSYLYHYTTLEGLRGIMRERRLWVTDIRFLNDSSELRQFFQALRTLGDDPTRVLQSPKHVDELNVWRGADGQPDYRVWSTRVLDFMEQLLSPEQDSSFMGVTCFSAVSDDLSQWRGYAPGQGLALRFDGARLQKWAISNGYGLIKCKYGPPFEHEVAEVLLKIDQSLSVESPFYMSRYLFPAVLRIAAGCKNIAFSAEQEWRIISRPFGSFLELIPYSQEEHYPLPLPNLEYRQGTSTRIPYIGIPIDDEDGCIIDSATVGPSEPESTRIAVCSLIDRPTFTSAIPYRRM